MAYPLSFSYLSRYAVQTILWAFLTLALSTEAAPRDFAGNWYEIKSDTLAGKSPLDLSALDAKRVDKVAVTGGRFLFKTDLSLDTAGRYVIDFKNTSVIGRFHHRVFDERNRLVAVSAGGIQGIEDNPFFLRHGRELELPAGQYQLITEVESPFFLGVPEPYLDTLKDYRQAIKPANALVLGGMGVFFGLGIYYAALALVRRRAAEGMYALFILGNFLFNGSALLVFPELLGMHWIYLVSLPILFSNAAYIVFVMALLELGKSSQPRLYKAGIALLAILGTFALAAAIKPNWSLELARYGVALFLCYGLTSGIMRACQGNVSAKLYLVAIAVFFMLGAVAITQAQLSGVYTLYIEHVGLMAVAVEVILLALVLSYQFAQLHREKEIALERMELSNRIAHTDALTGLPNRYALDIELDHLPTHASLTFLDLDGLKFYNDRFGHARGDSLLRSFAEHLVTYLGSNGRLFRIGGDEFALTCPSGNKALIESTLWDTMAHLHTSGFELAGVSAGSAYLHESANMSELKHLADTRMYENKRKRKQLELELRESDVV
jgi:diguanylate cyclase (GGDEF)-like protein